MPDFVTILPFSSSAIEKSMDAVANKVVSADLLKFDINPKTCNAKLLPFLAAAFFVSLDDLNEIEQRNFLANTRTIYSYQGTVYAVQKALDVVFTNAKVIEFEERPYIFSAAVQIGSNSKQVVDAEKFEIAKRLVNKAKNARSRFGEFVVRMPDVAVPVSAQGAVQWML